MTGTTMTGARPGVRAGGANRWVILVVLCVSLLFVALDATVLHVAIPSVTEDLRPGSVELLWIVDAYPWSAPPSSSSSAPWATGSAGAGSCCSATRSSARPPRWRPSPNRRPY